MTRFNVHNTPELAYCEQLHERFSQFDRIAEGAQASVHMLSNPNLCTTDTPDDAYTIPRVAKIALGQLAMARFVQEKVGLTDPYEVAAKVTELQRDQWQTYTPITRATRYAPADNALYWRLGHPKWIGYGSILADQLAVGEFTAEVAYTQDYAQPANQLFAKLNPNNEHHSNLAQDLFNQYVDIQRLLVSYGFFDTSYKLLDNYGVDEDGQLILLDFSELTQDRYTALRSLAAKEWRDLPNRPEQAHLPASFQAAFNRTLERALLPEYNFLINWGAVHANPNRMRGEVRPHYESSAAASDLLLRRFRRHNGSNPPPGASYLSMVQPDDYLQPDTLANANPTEIQAILDYSRNLPKRFTRIGQGAQYRVHMLTDRWRSRPTTPDYLYEIPRVIKHALTDAEALDYISNELRIREPAAQQRKLQELRSASAEILAPLFMEAIRDDDLNGSSLYDRLGCPKVHSFGKLESGAVIVTNYTQDYAQPVAHLLPRLDWRRAEHQELGRHIIDQYVDLQLLLIEHGYFDDIFKVVNNCGVDPRAKLILLDAGELVTDKAKVRHVIANKVWRNIPGKPEYTDLPDFLQAHLNEQMERRLTPEILTERWGIRKRSFTPAERQQAIDELADKDIRQTWIHHLLVPAESSARS